VSKKDHKIREKIILALNHKSNLLVATYTVTSITANKVGVYPNRAFLAKVRRVLNSMHKEGLVIKRKVRSNCYWALTVEGGKLVEEARTMEAIEKEKTLRVLGDWLEDL
jgi:hypothetical protein